jgi:hypothetical protein
MASAFAEEHYPVKPRYLVDGMDALHRDQAQSFPKKGRLSAVQRPGEPQETQIGYP